MQQKNHNSSGIKSKNLDENTWNEEMGIGLGRVAYVN